MFNLEQHRLNPIAPDFLCASSVIENGALFAADAQRLSDAQPLTNSPSANNCRTHPGTRSPEIRFFVDRKPELPDDELVVRVFLSRVVGDSSSTDARPFLSSSRECVPSPICLMDLPPSTSPM